MDTLEQFARVNLERTGELPDVFHSDISSATFDPTECTSEEEETGVRKFVQELSNNPFFWLSTAIVIVIRLFLTLVSGLGVRTAWLENQARLTFFSRFGPCDPI